MRRRQQKLCHDISIALANACVDTIAHCFRGEECKDLHEMFYQAARAALEYYQKNAPVKPVRFSRN